MDMKATLAGTLMAIAWIIPVSAQQPATSSGTVVTSEPGRAAVVRTVQTSAEVVRLDRATRTLTLKGPQGDTIDIVAGDQVKNFDEIKLGDIVVARYTKALALNLRKTKGTPEDVSVSAGSSQAKPGEQPGFTGSHQVTAIAEVVAVDPKENTIKLKGPQGNVVTFDVHNPDQFKVVKEGDQVDVTYAEAVALSVQRAP